MKAQIGGLIASLVIIAIIGLVAWSAYNWFHWATWTQPNSYYGVISSYTHHKGYFFGQTNYKIEFYGGSNVSFWNRTFTLAAGFARQPIDIRTVGIAAGKNCTLSFNGSFLTNAYCGNPNNASKPSWG